MRAALRADLGAAMKARHVDAVAALRTTLAAIDNAVAVATSGNHQVTSALIADAADEGGPIGSTCPDLTAGTVLGIVHTQISTRLARAERYDARQRRTAAD